MDKLLDDKSRLIDDVILNEMDYLHRNIEKLQAYKSKSLKEISTLREVQKVTEHRLEVKFRDFEMKENTRIAEYVKNSLNKDNHTRAVSDKRKEKTSLYRSKVRKNSAGIEIKSSGYGYNNASKENKLVCNVPNPRASSNITSTEENLIEEDVCSHNSNNSNNSKDNDKEEEEEEEEDAVSSYVGPAGNANVHPQDHDSPPAVRHAHPQSEPPPPSKKKPLPATTRQMKETKSKSKLTIVNDKVKKNKAAVPKACLPVKRDKNTPYLVKNPRERIVDFRWTS